MSTPHGADSFPRLQARTRRFSLGSPRDFRVAADGSRVLFLRSASGVEPRNSLWTLDTATGQESCIVDPAILLEGAEKLTAEERARRERTRTQSSGIVDYAIDQECKIAAFALSSRLFIVDVRAGDVRELPVVGSVIDPRPDPTGQRVGYVSAETLRFVELSNGSDHVLAAPKDDESEHVTWGLAEFIAAEEMDRYRGYWWSPNGKQMLAARVDTSDVQRWHIADSTNPDQPVRTTAYPAAGTPNAEVTLFLIDLNGSQTAIDWNNTEWPYLASVHWSAGGPPLIAVQSRDQQRMQIRAIDVIDGKTTVLQELTDPHWVDVVDGVPAWTTDGRLVTVAARDGAYRLLLDGEPVTGSDLQLSAVLDVADDVLFSATDSDPTQTHVYLAQKGGIQRLSRVDGCHTALRGGDTTVLISSTLQHNGPRVFVSRQGKQIVEIASLAETPPLTPNPIIVSVGEQNIRCAVLFPTGYRLGSGRLPVLMSPYGGPQGLFPRGMRVTRARNLYLTAQWWADQGFVVVVADGRGTPGRGPDWDRALYQDFAGVTLDDQIDALHGVAELYSDLDTDQVAISGWSYGGYLAALAVLRRPDAIHAAISGAPVTDWRLYDTHYTERYLGHPDEDPEVYKRNSLLADALSLHRPLLLIHGLVDDNVFVAHTLRLSSALLAAGRVHTVLPLSGAAHMGSTNEQEAENFLLLQVGWLKQALEITKESTNA